MMTSKTTTESAVEALIDASSLAEVLNSIEAVCVLKAEHIRHNWQDENTARVWDTGAKAVEKAWRIINPLKI